MIGDLDFELGCVLYNIGALHAELGALDLRNTAESMKVCCTHFQCAVWAFQHLRDDNRLYKSKDMSHDLLSFFVQVMLSQAQECILEKSMLDNRKSSIVAKVAAQVVEYYSSSLLMLLQSAINTNSSHTIVDIVGSKLYKEWKKFIELKVAYYNSICALFMGNLAEEQQKMGERVAWFESADVKLNEAIKLAKGMDRQEVSEALTFVSDVINVKLGNAKKENDFVYHEKVPTVDKLTEVKGVSLVKGISFSVCDPEISGPDIFARLVPIEAHETASIYSAKKDEIMRKTRFKIDDRNQELVAYMSSLQLDRDSLLAKSEGIPDELIEVCAAMSVNPNSVNEVNSVLNELEEISDEVDKAIKDTKNMIEEEERKEREHQQIYGKRPTSMIVVELSKELAKHEETHKKALLSNSSLRENLERHSDDVKLLISSSAQDISSLLPSTGANVPFNESNLAEMEKLLEKVEEMKSQRLMLENQLKETMASDDIMKQVLAHNKKEIEQVFDNEIKKYDRITSLIEQNLSAQDNILRALTKANAKYSETRRAILDNERNRSARIASLIHTFEVFRELQSNSKRGLDFYQKFQNIVIRLQARTRGVCRVQDEERDQICSAHKKKNTKYFPENNYSTNGETSVAPKLKDYLSYMSSSKPQSEPLSGPIPAANLLSNNSINIPPPSQNYPPSNLTQITYNRIENTDRHQNRLEPPQQQSLTNGQLNQPSVAQQYTQPSHPFPQSVQQYPQSMVPNGQHFKQQYSPPDQQNVGSTAHYTQQQYPQMIPQSVPQTVPQTVTQIISQTIPQSIPQSMPQSMIHSVPQPLHQSMAPSVSQSVPQPMAQTLPQQVLHSIPQTVSQQQGIVSQPYSQPNVPQYQSYPQTVQQMPQQPYVSTYQSMTNPYEQQYQTYGQQNPQQFQHSMAPQLQQTYPQSFEGQNNMTYDQSYQQPMSQYMPQMTQTIPQSMPQTMPQSIPMSISQPYSQSYPQTIPQSLSEPISQTIPQPIIQPIAQPIQPIQSLVETPVQSKIEKPSDKSGSDLLKQFDPLYDLNNGL